MKKTGFRKVLPRLVLALCTLLAAQTAYGDTYRRGIYLFNLPDVPPSAVEEFVVAASRMVGSEALSSNAHPILNRWQAMPCYVIRNGDAAAQSSLKETLNTFKARLNFDVPVCADSESRSIAYYFANDPTAPSERRAILDLMGDPKEPDQTLLNFLDGKSACYSHNWSRTSGGLAIDRAVVLLNSSPLNDAATNRCIFFSTAIALGLARFVGVPEGVSPFDESTEAWNRTVEINLLSLFVVYGLTENAAKGNREEVENSIKRLLLEMHVGSQ